MQGVGLGLDSAFPLSLVYFCVVVLASTYTWYHVFVVSFFSFASAILRYLVLSNSYVLRGEKYGLFS